MSPDSVLPGLWIGRTLVTGCGYVAVVGSFRDMQTEIGPVLALPDAGCTTPPPFGGIYAPHLISAHKCDTPQTQFP